MKIKLIDFGLQERHYPFRPHGNDAGADVYMPYDCTLQPGEIAKVPHGFPHGSRNPLAATHIQAP